MPLPAFISLDGIDGTGKSTQVALLADRLRSLGVPVTVCTDPGGTELGGRIRELLLHGRGAGMGMRAEALLFMASRAELVETVIRPALARGETVLSDRFVLANVAYQGYAGGLDTADLWTVGEFSTGGLSPDFTVVLDLPLDRAKARRKATADRLERRGDDYFERVRQGFLAESGRRLDAMRVVDASGDVPTVHEAVFDAVRPLLVSRGLLKG